MQNINNLNLESVATSSNSQLPQNTSGVAKYLSASKMIGSDRCQAISMYLDAIPFLEAEFDREKELKDKLVTTAILRGCYMVLRGEALMQGIIPTIQLPHDSIFYNNQVEELEGFLAEHDIHL